MLHGTSRNLAVLAGAIAGLWVAGAASAADKENPDRRAMRPQLSTQTTGTVFRPAVQDYVNLINSARWR